jgi:DNA-binding beta-propeller fold protein YncE
MNSRVQILDGNHNFKANIGSIGDRAGQFSRPKGVAVDSFGHVYVIDGMFDNLQVFDRQGHLLLTLGEAGTGPGQFWLPNGIAISRQNEIYVTDSYNRRVQVFKYVGAE